MKTVFFLILSIIFFSCINNEKENSTNDSSITIFFSSKIPNDTIFIDGKPMSVVYEMMSYKEDSSFITKQIPLSTIKNNCLKIKSDKPIIFNHKFYYENEYSIFYCFKPNDTIYIDYENNLPKIKSKKYNEYNYASKYLEKNKLDYYDDITFFSKFKKFKNNQDYTNDSIKNEVYNKKRLKYFDSLFNKSKISKLNYSLQTSSYLNLNKVVKGNEINLLSKKYNLSNNGNLVIVYKSYKSLFDKSKQENNLKNQFNFIKNLNIEKDNKNYLYWLFFENLGKRGLKETFIEYFETFEKENKNNYLIKYFNDTYPSFFKYADFKNEKQLILKSIKNESNVTLDGFLKSKSGKVLYVDLWASWCSPCRKLMPTSFKLHEELIDKQIDFVYISIDDDENKWIKAAKKDNLFLDNSFIAINYPTATFFNDIQLKAIPRYLIYDKTGKLVNSNAPSPESKEIKAELEKYINQ